MEHELRNRIIGATDRGLTIRVAGRETMVSWETVTGISAGRARPDRTSEHRILVLALEVRLSNREHLFLVGEIDPAWIPLTTNLHVALPEVAPFEVWGAAITTASAPIELYQRGT
ncbi:hypothetical protein [Sphingomonas abietis]|uniref:Uncharacterized protein n=1 Tax=Sphingomonas abietis TaxID=3012344 RepID=A0ABY7NQQ7_9SPHN|nr:hypothetical protein [Sphingomonas abietis]WBO23858.1 hypothetical protein PBT88_07005 [Sphingomonas abietis]